MATNIYIIYLLRKCTPLSTPSTILYPLNGNLCVALVSALVRTHNCHQYLHTSFLSINLSEDDSTFLCRDGTLCRFGRLFRCYCPFGWLGNDLWTRPVLLGGNLWTRFSKIFVFVCCWSSLSRVVFFLCCLFTSLFTVVTWLFTVVVCLFVWTVVVVGRQEGSDRCCNCEQKRCTDFIVRAVCT